MYILASATRLLSIRIALPSTIVQSDINVYPDVLPGPNMPSLASMGLDSASLYLQAHELLGHAESTIEQAQYLTGVFGTGVVPTLCMSDIEELKLIEFLASYLYLYALGSTQCGVVVNKPTLWVSTGNVYIRGKNVGGSLITYSNCSDVAASVAELIISCVLAGNRASFGGQAVAKGNSAIAIQLGYTEEAFW